MESSALPLGPFRLVTLGRIALETPGGEDADLGKRRRKLALLAVLALSPEPIARDVLAEMFWGDEDPERARHSLSDALSHLRRVLGRHAITGRTQHVALSPDVRLSLDVTELERAFSEGDHARVRELYRGAFMESLGAPPSGLYDAWVMPLRARYAALAEQSAAASTVAVRSVPTRARRRFSGRRMVATLAGTAAVASLLGGIGALEWRRAAAAPTAPLALTDVWTDPADTSIAWLRDGFRQMIAADLDRVLSPGVVAPSAVREATSSASHPDSLSDEESRASAGRLHARFAASAAVVRRGDAYIVSITLRDVNQRGAEHYVITGPNILAVADQAAAKILTVVDASRTGPRLSAVETANIDAYRHFIHSQELQAIGDHQGELRELDSAIAVDSGFTSALGVRLRESSAEDYPRLRRLFDRARPRMTQWDWMSNAVWDADHGGRQVRAESLARDLVAQFPRDPRALSALAGVQQGHAHFFAAESALVQLIALDSASAPNSVPCWLCEGYGSLAAVLHDRGDFTGEVRVAQEWTRKRPAYPSAWLLLANSLALNGEVRAAEGVYARYRLLAGNEFDGYTGRLMVVERRYDAAEAYARRYLHSASANDAYDLLQTVLRERGQYHAALAAFAEQRRAHLSGGLDLVEANTLGAVSEDARARTLLEAHVWHPGTGASATIYAENARGFAWYHTIEADAIWQRADTSQLRALADSVERIGALSSYARDWTIAHHIRGLIAERGGRFAEARDEFERALSLVPGFTRTNLELARMNLLLGAPERAIATLRRAYHEPMDAMGRYAPRSELDYEMSIAFRQAGQADSARRYASFARAAWVRGDPAFIQRLSALP